MAEFLSAAWLQELDDVARASPNLADLARETNLVVEQRVSDAPHGDVAYHLLIDDRGARVMVGNAADPDLVLTTSFQTACALMRGDISAQQAIASGGLKVGGNVSRLPRRSDALAVLTDVFGVVRATTTGTTPDDGDHR